MILLALMMIAGIVLGFRISFRYYSAKADLEVVDVI